MSSACGRNLREILAQVPDPRGCKGRRHSLSALVVGDAMFCQRDVCQEILDSGGDYLLAVKENQPGLLRDIALEFAAQPAARSFISQNTGPLQPAGARVGTRNMLPG